jgi:hypothetical protein
MGATGMNVLMGLLLISTILITIGWYSKLGLISFFIGFTYLWLIDKGYFNNHYYLMSLISFLLIWMPVENSFSLNKKKQNLDKKYIPYWPIMTLKLQWFLVFFIAGLAKVNKFWILELQPMKHAVAYKAEITGNEIWNSEIWPLFFSYGGLIFDLSIGFLLWSSKTRILGIILLLFFNVSNLIFFHDIGEIGIFPLFVICSVVLFIEPEKISSTFNTKSIEIKKSKSKNKIEFFNINKSVSALLIIWFAFQILFPFRYLLYDNNPEWSGDGNRFSWRMKLAYKNYDFKFYVYDPLTKDKYPVKIENMLTQKQYNNLGYYPEFIPPLAIMIKKEAILKGVENAEIRADFLVGFNDLPQKFIVDPNIDLSSLTNHIIKPNYYVLPLDY